MCNGQHEDSVRFDLIDNYEHLICLDSEWTCWETSLQTRWSNPKYPPEVIQIGLAIYEIANDNLSEEYVSYISPTINPTLSAYCKNLLNITQETIDQARSFSEVVNEISLLLREYSHSSGLVCSFGADWEFIAADAEKYSVDDPFAMFDKMDLRLELSRILKAGYQSVDREVANCAYNMTECSNRHDALTDARDVKRILDAIRSCEKSFVP